MCFLRKKKRTKSATREINLQLFARELKAPEDRLAEGDPRKTALYYLYRNCCDRSRRGSASLSRMRQTGQREAADFFAGRELVCGRDRFVRINGGAVAA